MKNLPLSNGWTGHLVEAATELPAPEVGATLYLDLETATTGVPLDDYMHARPHGDRRRGGTYPYLGDSIAGIAATWGDEPDAWYVPVRHTDVQWNLPVDDVRVWLRRVFEAPEWVNHNIKFDAHFIAQELGETYAGDLVDTLTLAKILDSDRFGHGLKSLCREWCGLKMRGEKAVTQYLAKVGSKNYADVPADVLGSYACEDVLGNRALFCQITADMPEALTSVCATERKMTKILLEVERRGLHVPRTSVKVEFARSLEKLIVLKRDIDGRLGWEYTDSPKSNKKVFLDGIGLPVLKRTTKDCKECAGIGCDSCDRGKVQGGPSFDKEVMAQYKVRPEVLADEETKRLVDAIDAYRTEKHFKGLFLQPYLFFADEDEVVHFMYNQVVRTGRLSGYDPNPQQLNERAKRLVHPRPGHAFLSFDASQVEFRWIVHYIRDEEAITAYHADPRIDFHAWVAKMVGVTRGPAKTINFMVGFGGGEKKITSNLRANPDIVREAAERVNKMNLPPEQREAVFQRELVDHASRVYRTYHARFPTLKPFARRCERNASARGWIKNIFGRRRHLPAHRAHTAFNAVVQSCAEDYLKTRRVALWEDARLRACGLELVAFVHDEIVLEGPVAVARDPDVQAYVLAILQTDPIGCRVPLRWDAGYSERDWAEAAKSKEAKLDIAALEEIATRKYGWKPGLRPH